MDKENDMSKWEDKLDTIRALAGIGADTATIADLVGTTASNLQTVAKRNGIKLSGGTRVGAGAVYQVPLDQLRRDPQQPREQFDPAGLDALAESLKTDGQETPVRFRLSDIDDGGAPFMIVHGERRCRAAVRAGLATIDGVLDTRDDSPADRILRQIADNEQREALTAWDWSVAISRLAESGLKHTEISERITARGIKGFSRPVVSNYCRLQQLPPTAIELLQAGKITPAHGKYLLQCKDDEIRAKLIAGIIEEDEAPTVERLQWKIGHEYSLRHRSLSSWGVGERCHFDWETTCKGCDFCHKADDNTYCTDPSNECWKRNQFRAERQRAQEREQRELAAADASVDIEACDLDTLRETDPAEAARIEHLRERREEQRQYQEQRDKNNALISKAADRVGECDDLDTLIVLALEPTLTDWHLITGDDQVLTLTQWRDRCALNRIEMLRMLAREALDGYVDPDSVPHVARMLGLDPDGDYREHSNQLDLDEDAA
jgi:ParB/RepB/Spo0J family partition protein